MSASPNDSKFLGETKKQYEVRVTQSSNGFGPSHHQYTGDYFYSLNSSTQMVTQSYSGDRPESPDYSFLPNGNGYYSTSSTKPVPIHNSSSDTFSSTQDFTPDSSQSSTHSEYSSSNGSERSQFSSQSSQSSNNSSHSNSSNDYEDEGDLSHEEEQLARTYKPVFMLNKFNNIDSFVKYDNGNTQIKENSLNSNGVVIFSIPPTTGRRNVNSSNVHSSMDTTGDKPKSGINPQSSLR